MPKAEKAKSIDLRDYNIKQVIKRDFAKLSRKVIDT
jgi:hypothetical protein